MLRLNGIKANYLPLEVSKSKNTYPQNDRATLEIYVGEYISLWMTESEDG